MGKYISKYSSINEFNLDASTLSYPHVSLIEDTGLIKYHPYIPPVTLNAAPFGSIAIYDRTGNSFIIIDNPDDYSDTEYLTDNYMPFAICIDPKTNRNDNKAVWMVHPSVLYKLAGSNNDWAPKVYNSLSASQTDVNNLKNIITSTDSTIEKNAAIRALNSNSYGTIDIATVLPYSTAPASSF